MLSELLKSRLLPAIDTDSGVNALEMEKLRIREMLCSKVYGDMPPEPADRSYTVIENDSAYCASKATLQTVEARLTLRPGVFSFRFHCCYPNDGAAHKTILYLSFDGAIPDRYLPLEELCDNGFTVAVLDYRDVTADNADFTNGLAGCLYPLGARKPDEAGKLMLWAWAAMRVMDYLLTQETADRHNIAVAGHSRLGKTALLTAAMDERFAFCYANNSGCCGAALSRGKRGEGLRDITDRFPFWFCENFVQSVREDLNQPFDQHWLLSLIAPRPLYVASAADDLWADPASEFLSCAAASQSYAVYGVPGLKADDSLPSPGDSYPDGNIGYHLRLGCHYLCRQDWQQFMRYMEAHANGKAWA